MRSLLLIGLALLFSSGAYAEEDFSTDNTVRVKIADKDAVKLDGIQKWLHENLSQDDCPNRAYYGVLSKDVPVLLGFEVFAECPEAPSPHVSLFFDSEQNYLELDL